jgi:hypothetical protein
LQTTFQQGSQSVGLSLVLVVFEGDSADLGSQIILRRVLELVKLTCRPSLQRLQLFVLKTATTPNFFSVPGPGTTHCSGASCSWAVA